MSDIKDLLESNKAWANEVVAEQPEFFTTLAKQQNPEYLWIGCSDSRVPANQIVGRLPGEMFVHRNVANLVKHTDLNCLSVVQYAVDVLKVKHIIVCGHYGCGGVRAAMGQDDNGIVDTWLRSVKDMYSAKRKQIESIADDEERFHKFCEMNVEQQVLNLSHSKAVQRVWQRGQDLAIHGWVYGLEDGVLKDLNVSVSSMNDIEEIYRVTL